MVKRHLGAKAGKDTPKYKLVLHATGRAEKSPPAKDYVARLTRYQPRPLSASAAKALRKQNRGAD